MRRPPDWGRGPGRSAYSRRSSSSTAAHTPGAKPGSKKPVSGFVRDSLLRQRFDGILRLTAECRAVAQQIVSAFRARTAASPAQQRFRASSAANFAVMREPDGAPRRRRPPGKARGNRCGAENRPRASQPNGISLIAALFKEPLKRGFMV
jgi:hypothetical protein